jgi:ABC-type uncharacterized transport system auxiliary subunit
MSIQGANGFAAWAQYTRFGAPLLALALNACSSAPAPEIHEYLLRGEDPAPVAPAEGAVTLHLARVDVAGHLDGIVITRSGGQADTLVYHRWAAPISEMVARQVRAHCLASGAFRHVLPPESPGTADYSLRIGVERLEIDESESGGSVARVRLDCTLFKETGREVIWSRRLDTTAPVASGASVPVLVAALDDALSQAVRELAAALPSQVQPRG